MEAPAPKGRAIRGSARKVGVSDHAYYVWRKANGSMGVEQARRLKDPEKENVRLERLAADLSLDKDMLI